MPKILGVDIAKLVNDNLGSLLLDAQLRREIKSPRGDSELTAGQRRSHVSYPCKGFIDSYSDEEQELIGKGIRKVTLLGGSLPDGVVPQSDDEILIEGRTLTILGIPRRDPAAATYECRAQL